MKKLRKTDKDYFNSLMKEFYSEIENYTGGHPRMISNLLDLELDINKPS